MRKSVVALIAIVIALVAVGAAWYAMTARIPPSTTAPISTPPPTNTTAPTTTSTGAPPTASVEYAVALTDPPVVPVGTDALPMNYSGVAVHTEGGWISNASANGTVNLLGLQNLSVVLANFRIMSNETVNAVRLYISNASIVVNGTEYPLMLPSGELTIPITNASRAFGALVDLQPHVFETYVGDQPVFVMAPAAVAVPMNYTAPPGSTLQIPMHLREELGRFSANVTITSESLQVEGNETFLTVTVKNDGNESVEITGVSVHGPWAIEIPPLVINNSYFSADIVVEGARANMTMLFFANGTQLVPAAQMVAQRTVIDWPLPPGATVGRFGVTWTGNASAFEGQMTEWVHYMDRESWYNFTIVGPHQHMNFTNWPGAPFNLTSYFSALPWSGPGQVSQYRCSCTPPAQFNFTPPSIPTRITPPIEGYTLPPGQSVTLTFEGIVAMGPQLRGAGFVDITIVPVAGENYTIALLTMPPSNATAVAAAG